MELLEKYEPKNYKEIIGNKTTYDKLLKELKKTKYKGKYLLTGKSGTGKTTFIKILSKEKKYKIQNIKITDIITRGDETNNKLKLIFKKTILPKIILIDDIDMSTNITSIRNGIETKLKMISKFINKDKTNLIFLVSTENKKSIFKTYEDLKTFSFKKIREETIKKYILSIIEKENITLSNKTGDVVIKKLIKDGNYNLRKIIMNLDILVSKKSKIKYNEETKELLNKNKNDIKFTDMYDYLKTSLKQCNMKNIKSYEKKEKLYYTDSFLLSASVYEYYLKGENVKDTKNMDLVCKSIDSISDGDVLNKSRRDSDFSLMPYIGHLSYLIPNQLTGMPKTQIFFPSNVSKDNKILNNNKKKLSIIKEQINEEKNEIKDYNYEDYIYLYTIQNNKKLKKKEQYVNQTKIKNIFSLVTYD